MEKSESQSDGKIISMFGALGDPTRFKLIRLLLVNKDYCVSELAEKVGISTAGTSQQLKVLEQSGIVERGREGQKICYRVRKEDSTVKRLLAVFKIT